MRKECLVECIIKYYRCFSMLRYQGVFIVQYACKLSSTKDSPYFCIDTSVHISETCISQCLMTSSLCNIPANHAIPDYVTFDCDESVLVRSVQTLAGRCNWLPVTTFTTCQNWNQPVKMTGAASVPGIGTCCMMNIGVIL